jgi:hypothetical protein
MHWALPGPQASAACQDGALFPASGPEASAARQDGEALKTPMRRRKVGANDVDSMLLWDYLPGDYSRFLTQVDPGSGDVGLWNIDASIYGRFARAFAHESGKTEMRFELDEAFQAETIVANVTYLQKSV